MAADGVHRATVTDVTDPEDRGRVRIELQIDAGMVTVNAGMAKFSGVVQCDTLIASSVVAQSYTPGVGNIA